jgi:hypothetical protein
MLVSAFAAMFLLAAPEAAQPAQTPAPETKSTEAKGPKKTCYTTTPSGSRMPRKVCVTQAPSGDDKAAEKTAEPK